MSYSPDNLGTAEYRLSCAHCGSNQLAKPEHKSSNHWASYEAMCTGCGSTVSATLTYALPSTILISTKTEWPEGETRQCSFCPLRVTKEHYLEMAEDLIICDAHDIRAMLMGRGTWSEVQARVESCGHCGRETGEEHLISTGDGGHLCGRCYSASTYAQ